MHRVTFQINVHNVKAITRDAEVSVAEEAVVVVAEVDSTKEAEEVDSVETNSAAVPVAAVVSNELQTHRQDQNQRAK